MIRRAVLVAAAAVVLILSPVSAMAQAAVGTGVPATSPSPVAGVPFTVHASGAKANEVVTLTITPVPASIGTTSLTQKANGRGVVNFVVTLTKDGTYALVSRSASGAVLSRQAVTVAQQGAVIVAGVSASAGKAGSVPAGKAGSVPAGKGASVPAGKAASAPAGTAAQGQLSFTGFGGMGLAVGGAVLVVAGAGLVLGTRRRMQTHT